MTKKFRLQNLECASCASKIEDRIKKLDGVHSISINFMTTRMTLEADEDKMEQVLEAAKKIIKRLEPGTKLVKA